MTIKIKLAVPKNPVRCVEFFGQDTYEPGLRIEARGEDFAVTFRDHNGHWPSNRWSDINGPQLRALIDALTQLLEDNE